VAEVKDGDTMVVLIDGQKATVRFVNVDAPEEGQPLSAEAKEYVEGLVAGKTVCLEHDVVERDKDRDGRLLRYVWVGNVMVEDELVRYGLAEVRILSKALKYQTRFVEVQAEAQLDDRGLWALDDGCPYVGDKRRRLFHYFDCPDVSGIPDDDRTCLQTREEALGRGYSPHLKGPCLP
jgi:micrococcal nuclease